MAGSGGGCSDSSFMLLESEWLGIDCDWDWDFPATVEACLVLRGPDWAARTGHSTSWPYTTAVVGMTTPSG